LIYGMYDCFNVVTDQEGHPSAVLVRALSPIENCLADPDGPGKLCRALTISRVHNKADLTIGPPLFIEPGEPPRRTKKGPRIGVDYAGHWKNRHLRFWIAGDPWVSGSPAGVRRRRVPRIVAGGSGA
jgi:DNA-3-methyladenine glycosylase